MLKILRFENGGLEFLYPNTKGQAPTPRYQHTMVHYPKENLLIVYGGRNDSMSALRGTFTYSNLVLFNLENLCWMTVNAAGPNTGGARFSHCAAVHKDRMLVFGGLRDSAFVNDDMRILELSK